MTRTHTLERAVEPTAPKVPAPAAGLPPRPAASPADPVSGTGSAGPHTPVPAGAADGMESTDRRPGRDGTTVRPVPGNGAWGSAPGTSRPTIGSMCSGFGGLDAAVMEVFGGRLAWVADPDPGAAKVLTHHHPDVPNLADITAVDFSAVEPVDIVCAGFPCQDISYAGRGAGIREGTRSGLWHTIAGAVGVLRPRLLVLENVAGIVSRRPGLDVVLADLAALGFDAEWTCVRASDVGAPHQRNRWFLVAHPANNGFARSWRARDRWPGSADRDLVVADSAGDGRDERRTEPAGQQRRPDAALGGSAPTDADGGRFAGHPKCDGGPLSAQGRHEQRRVDPLRRVLDWGNYTPAVDRWAAILGRPAPAPTQPGIRGGQRLAPAFVEWMMGLPEGHVTAVPGLSYGQQLQALGNGVVPQQGAEALRRLLNAREVAA